MDQISINPVVLIIAIAAAVAIAVALILYIRKERTQKLRSKFGPEYDRAIDTHGNRSHAESELERRTKRVASFNIHPLTSDECARYADNWRHEQSLFVDDPKGAVRHADNLVQDVMKQRGYPVVISSKMPPIYPSIIRAWSRITAQPMTLPCGISEAVRRPKISA
jgi:hypothetical protein